MGRTYIGYGYTNAEGVATLDYDANGNQLPKKSYACHSRNTSVVAEASIDNVITASNSIRFCENYVPPSETLSLTADKNILSYADGDTVTLTATYDGTTIEGKSVVFKIGDTVLATETTDSEGVAEYEYSSQGIGDVTITVECMNLQETYELEDCTRYNTTEYTTRQDVQWAMPTGDFEISADLLGTATTGSYPQLYIGTALNTHHISIGQMASTSGNYVGMEFKKDNSRLSLQTFNSSQAINTYYNVKLTRVGNYYTLYWNNQTLTYTNSTISPTYLFLIYLPYGKCKNIKIKPL